MQVPARLRNQPDHRPPDGASMGEENHGGGQRCYCGESVTVLHGPTNRFPQFERRAWFETGRTFAVVWEPVSLMIEGRWWVIR